MITAYLHGNLGKMFPGNNPDGSWSLDVKTPRELMEAIEANTNRLLRYIIEKDKEGVNYRVVIDGKDFCADEQIYIPMGEYQTIDIIPVVQGAGIGIWELVAGIVLIAAGIILNIIPGAGTPFLVLGVHLTAAAIGSVLILYGIALVIGGIYALLFGGQTVPDQTKNHPSYIFSGAANSAVQGDPIPICYGRLITGSEVISQYETSLEINQDGTTKSDVPTDPNPPDSEAASFAPFDVTDGLQATRLGDKNADGVYTSDAEGTANDNDFVPAGTAISSGDLAKNLAQE